MMTNTQQYKKVLSQFPTGVSVITALDNEDKQFGITVNSFASVSLSPKLILWSIDKTTLSLEVYLKATSFAISFLNDQQQKISNHFAMQGEFDKFKGIDISLANNLPIIKDSVGFLFCKTREIIEAGDHYIIIGEVIDAQCDEDKHALIYYQGQYKES